MAIKLVDALLETLAGWQSDLSGPWQEVFENIELGFSKINPDLQLLPCEPIFPSRKEFTHLGAPAGAHIFRAFDDIQPDEVRCVVLGQDPYPCPAFSTGRAFEAGGYREWRELEKMWSLSMRSFMQFICAVRADNDEYAQTTDDWSRVLNDIESGVIDLPPPSKIAQHWVEQGVLLLNSSFTITRFAITGDPHQVEGHIPLWRPLIVRAIRYFMKRQRNPVVFILFGDVAQSAMLDANVVNEADMQGHRQIVATLHPAAGNDFLGRANPFRECNNKLQAMRLEAISW